MISLYMALMSAWAGGSLWPSQYLKGFWANIPEICFALGFVWALFPLLGYWSLIAGVWSYLWMQTGHANALMWGRKANPYRENTLSPVIKWIADMLGIEHYSPSYARLFMAVKGLLITLPVGGTGALFWPLGYEIGNHYKHWLSEFLAGAGAGLSIVIFRSLI